MQSGISATVLSPNKLTPKQALALIVDAIEATGLVVVQKPNTIVIKLGPNMPRPCTGVVGSAPPTVLLSHPSAEPGLDLQSVSDLAATGIRALDEEHYEVRELLVQNLALNLSAVASGVRSVPVVADGKPAGLKLYTIRPNSLLSMLGFVNGDALIAINRHPINSVDDVRSLYGTFHATRVEVDLVRRRARRTLVFTIVP